jgi:mycofactocin precursor
MKSAEPDQRTAAAPPRADSETLEQSADRARPKDELIESELLVEDVSIDGMCGVY